jgi:hypothetical protein
VAAHYLQPLTEPFIPLLHVSVALETRRVDGGDVNDNGVWLECEAWHLSVSVMIDGCHRLISSKGGKSPLELWEMIADVSSSQLTAWLWCLGLPQLLTITDWYGMLESGGWTIGGSGLSRDSEMAAKKKRGFRGFFVANDPPNLVLAKHQDTGLVLQMVDVKNFGIRSWSDLSDGKCTDIGGDVSIPWDALDAADRAEIKSALLQRWVVSWCDLVMRQHWGPLRPTGSGQAMTAFRTRYISSPILIHGNSTVARLERDAYYTGRCECYRIGTIAGPIHHFDFESFYSSIASRDQMPARLVGYKHQADIEDIEIHRHGFCVIADVTVATKRADYPYRPGRPVRAVATSRGTSIAFGSSGTSTNVIYPLGIFRTVLCWPELEYLYDSRSIVQVHRIAWYEPSSLLRLWAANMLELRALSWRTGVHGVGGNIKFMANCLYGAFAKRSRRWEAKADEIAPSPYCTWFSSPGGGEPCKRYRSIGGRVEYETYPKDGPETLVAVPAWLCSLARVRLSRLLRCCGAGRVYYCDTDSIWCNSDAASAVERAMDAYEFNGLKIRHVGTYGSMTIYCQRCYSYDNRHVHSGAPADAAELSDGALEWEVCEGMESALRRHDRPMPRMVRRRRSRPKRYNGGNVDLNGNVSPLIIGEP